VALAGGLEEARIDHLVLRGSIGESLSTAIDLERRITRRSRVRRRAPGGFRGAA
jgi:hypothetical protein